MPKFSKDDLFGLLGSKSYVLASWCIDRKSTDAKVISYILENVNSFDTDGELFRETFLPILLKNKIINRSLFDSINEHIGNDNPVIL